MVIHIIIGGESQCDIFAQICLIADYLCQNLPNFCYERIEKSVVDWQTWLCRVNVKNNWHHVGSPIIWKELLMKGSKPYYIGGAPEFLEYCHSYYNFDVFMGMEKYQGLVKNYAQFKRKLKQEEIDTTVPFEPSVSSDPADKTHYVVCITGASCPLANHLVSRLLDMSTGTRCISKIFLYDEDCSPEFLESIETECSYIGTNFPGRVVKYVDKIGNALTITDVLIVLDHEPFDPNKSIGEWLHANMRLMQGLAIMINASASRSIYIVFANLGPACFNATVLMHSVTVNVRNIVVATTDLGLEIVSTLSEKASVPVRQVFCPPVWGFVGVNHLVDYRTTVHKYNTFEPYNRYTKVTHSTLNIGRVTPEMRTMEYLFHFDDSIWLSVAEKKKHVPPNSLYLNKVVSLLNLIRVWIVEPSPPDYVVNLGVLCDGSFGLTFNGAFSQPCRLYGREWRPAKEFYMPRDLQVKLPYLEQMAEIVMKFHKKELPPLEQYYPCACRRKYYKKKEVW
ncbi:putative malate dehydrogenase 1B [Pectinophora gossypiella]|uniref:putative malate dehydrogenase 1B n=1 Tax=Pectinophora gossypiella TaxID=13191 RepID=UPI00214E313C|nr:putative malate dehydrogenase 1B [Pectinophora gossypiella]